MFLSVPKTGTTAFETALAPFADIVVSNPPELKHAPLYRYNRFFRPMFEKVCNIQPETLAVMREPIDWMGSWYRYRQRDFLRGKPNSTQGISFDEFAQAYCQEKQPAFANIGSQAKFLEKRPNGTEVTHLFRYDDQAGLLAFLETRLGRRIPVERSNVSPAMPLTLSPDTEATLRQKYAEDFALYASLT